jgi:hypothetical protein
MFDRDISEQQLDLCRRIECDALTSVTPFVVEPEVIEPLPVYFLPAPNRAAAICDGGEMPGICTSDGLVTAMLPVIFPGAQESLPRSSSSAAARTKICSAPRPTPRPRSRWRASARSTNNPWPLPWSHREHVALSRYGSPCPARRANKRRRVGHRRITDSAVRCPS